MEPIIKSAPVFIRSMSCVTPFGLNALDLWDACVSGQKKFEQGLLRIEESFSEECRQRIPAIRSSHSFAGVESNELLSWSLFAIQEALREAGWDRLNEDVGFIIATTTGLTKVWEGDLMDYFRTQVSEGHLYHPLGSFALELQNQLSHTGPVQLISSACCAGTQAVGMARAWIQSGYVKKCLVLGAEQICQLTDTGFRSLSLVNGEDCFPFNESHNNICLSEAVAVLCLDRESDEAIAEITGFGCSSDGHSMTAPKPDGSGPRASMMMALKDAGITPQELDWIHAHGTGSVQNDRAEAAAIKQLDFLCPVTSTKAIHGHSLAASGVLETVLCVTALQKQQILPTWGCDASHFNINLETELEPQLLKRILKNTLGFGGINSTLIFQKVGVDA